MRRKLIGALLVQSPFAAAGWLAFQIGGWSAVAIVFGGTAAIVAVICVGIWLMNS